ncbi:hypothetical protein LUW77_03270 [Streptomyces radiopugnans]|nr:hypothetical protein LUW77_03270 [Streptomyces radiopugnans]
MMAGPPLEAELLHLADRAERGVLLPAEAARLRDGIRALSARCGPVQPPGLPEPRPPADSPRDDHTDPKENRP